MRKFYKVIVFVLSFVLALSNCMSAFAVSFTGDIVNDGALKANDLVETRNAFLKGDFDIKYDINGDGSVDARDLVNLKKKIAYYIDDEKFVANSVSKVGNAKDITLGHLFSLIGGMKIDSKLVRVEINTENSGVTYQYTANYENWTEGIIDFSGTGAVSVTIYEYCKPTTIEVEIVNEVKFKVNESVKETYGNASIITVGTLFSLIDSYTVDSAKVNVTAVSLNGDVSCEIVPDTENWEKGKLEFDGTGDITITVVEESEPTSVSITVVDADKFDVIVDDPYTVKNTDNVVLGDIFAELADVDIDSDKVVVSIAKANELDNVDWEFISNENNWTAGIIDFSGEGQVTVTIEEDSKPTTLTIIVEAIEKFTPISGVELYENEVLKIGDIFNALDSVSINSADVVVTTDNGTWTKNETDWKNGTIKFDTFGTVTVTIKEDSKVATATVKVLERVPTDKFEIRFTNTEKYLYRVGNGNAVALESLFKAIDGADIGTVTATVTALDGSNASGLFTENSDWPKSTIKFEGTGPVAVSITDNYYCNELTLNLEIVDAKNTTTAVSATANNVVLLNDCGFSTIEVNNGYTLYGNGFTLSSPSDITGADLSTSYVLLNNGTLDNVKVICPNFPRSIMYDSQAKVPDNVDATAEWRYHNIRSAVSMEGTSNIYNSYVSGGRAAVNVLSGSATISDTIVYGGATANILLGAAQKLTLRNINLIQEPIYATVNDTSKSVMGFSVLVLCSADGSSVPIALEGKLVQYAWANESYKNYVPDGADSIIGTVLSQKDYKHSIALNGESEAGWFNLGFAYMPAELGSSVNTPTIASTDNRTNKSDVPYDIVTISAFGTKSQVYSYKNTNGTNSEFITKSEYAPVKHEGVLPNLSYTELSESAVFSTQFDETYGWNSSLKVDLDALGSYNFDFSKLLAQKYGKNLTYTVADTNNITVDKSQPISLTNSGIYKYTLYVNDDLFYDANGVLISGKSELYTIHFELIATMTSISPPSLVTEVGGEALLVVKSNGGDWSCALPALKGTQIKYWSVAEKQYKTLTLSDITPTSTGKQNSTNNYWTYSTPNKDYTLTVTCGVIHEGKSVYGMPVVVDNNGTYEMYFTISNTNGYVSSGTTARTVTVSYEFKDNNGGSLTFSKTWSCVREDMINAGAIQYSYNDFISGKLTDTASGGGSGCVTPDTLITLADGNKIRVDSLKGDEQLLVWNLETGKLASAPIMFIDSDPNAEYEVIKLYFSDGTEVKVISEHGFWDYDLNKYVYLDNNACDYIGHTFAKQNGEVLEKVQLINVVIDKELTTAWSPVTVGHLCYFVNGMLSIPGGVGGLFNIFEVDAETMTYDFEAIERDIETYGLFTYEELSEYAPSLSEDMFNAAGGQYLKISIGKGNLTMDELIAMIERYSKYI